MARDVLREQEIVRRAARTRTVVADVALDRHDRESAEVRVQAGGRLEEQPRELGQAVVAEMPEMRRDEYAPRSAADRVDREFAIGRRNVDARERTGENRSQDFAPGLPKDLMRNIRYALGRDAEAETRMTPRIQIDVGGGFAGSHPLPFAMATTRAPMSLVS